MKNTNIHSSWHYFDPSFAYEQYFQDYDWPWAGHKYFVYDFVRNQKPKNIVELGTQRGTSLFSVAQAVKDGQLSTRIFAVDTWKGDKHTGPYNETYYQDVQTMKSLYYPSLEINLLRTTFDEAVKQFKPNSIDFLHIDGLHTYKAVKHDFTNWLGRVSKNGTVIFHDTNEKREDFGVYRLWAKLKKQYPSFEFLHSHGLGVLFLAQKNSQYQLTEEIWQRYYSRTYELKVLEQVNLQLTNNKLELVKEQTQLTQEINRLKGTLDNTSSELASIKASKMYRSWREYHRLKELVVSILRK